MAGKKGERALDAKKGVRSCLDLTPDGPLSSFRLEQGYSFGAVVVGQPLVVFFAQERNSH